MKSNFKFLALIAFFGILLNSCSSDDDGTPSLNAPEITNFEFGEGSTHSTDPVAYKGSDVHLEADIYAEAGVSSITLIIHAHDLPVGEGEEEWDFEMVYQGEQYQAINPDFHVHVDVPATAPAGEYHVELLVMDDNGNSTEVDGHLEVLDPITISNISIDATVVRGDHFDAEFDVEAVHGIHQLTVDIHAHGLTVGAGEVEWDQEFVFSDGFHGLTGAEFHEHIDVPATAPVGEYHLTFTIEDEEGNTESFETHIDVTAS